MRKSLHSTYIRRIAGYTWANKRLLFLTVLMGTLGVVAPFIFPRLIGSLIDDVIQPRGNVPLDQKVHRLWQLTFYGIATAFLFAISGYGRGHFNMQLGNRIVVMLRKDLFEHFQRLSLQFYSRQRTGGIVWRLMDEVHGVSNLVHAGVILFFLDFANIAIALTLLLGISWQLTLAVLVVVPLYVVTFKIFNPLVRQASERVHQHFGKVSGNVHEHFTGVALVKSYAAEERETRRFMKDNNEHLGYIVKQSHVGHLVGAISDLWVHLGTCIIIGYGGYLSLTGSTQLTAGGITKFLGYVGIMYGPVKRFADLNLVYQNSIAAIRRVFRIFEIEPQIVEKPNAVRQPPQVGEVRFANVRFCYGVDSDETRIRLDEDEPDASPFKIDPKIDGDGKVGPCLPPGPGLPPRWVIDDVSIDVRRGERVAFVGPSGCGKTTLVSLLPRLFDVVHGSITVDGVDVRDYTLNALRGSIAIVQQDSFIFSGSVRDNLLYGRPAASEDEVIAAAKAANAHEFILQMPEGYRTLLGERGTTISGGQRQRLSIARAILRDPKILILDEATSALDTESEVLVQDALERLMRGRTCLIIAHRLSTVRTADRIYAMRHGKIIETGRHEELLERNGVYARLARAQLAHPNFHQDPVKADVVGEDAERDAEPPLTSVSEPPAEVAETSSTPRG